jgi:hypothetical protein
MTKQVLSLLLLILSLSSCRYHEGTLISNASITPSSELVGYASGEAETSIVLGFGGLNTQTLIRDAKQNLYLNHPLKKGQAYANMGVDVSRSFYPFSALPVVVKNMVVVSADVVNLDPDKVGEELQPLFISLQENRAKGLAPLITLPWVQRQDTVLLFERVSFQKAVLQDLINQEKAIVIKQDGKTKRCSIENLFVTKDGAAISRQKYRIGDVVETKLFGYTLSGVVIGTNPTGLLLQTSNRILKLEDKDLAKEAEAAQETDEK